MKKLTAIIGMCLVGIILQAGSGAHAQAAPAPENGRSARAHRQFDPEKVLVRIQDALDKRQAQMQKATSMGRADIAAALQKLITDLNNMKAAVNSKDRDAFKAANEQRKADLEALQALWKSGRGGDRNGTNAGATEL